SVMRGKEQETVSEVPAGDIAAVAKLADTTTGDVLGARGADVEVEPFEPPAPVLAIAIKAKTKSDEDKLANALHRLLDEDPALRLERNAETHQTLLRGQGETHIGFKEAMAKADPILLEPVSEVVVLAPEVYQGDIMGDLNSKRGRIQGSSAAGNGEVEVVALVPTSEVLRYTIDLRSMTGGRGRFTVSHSHYDPLPAHLVDKVRAAIDG